MDAAVVAVAAPSWAAMSLSIDETQVPISPSTTLTIRLVGDTQVTDATLNIELNALSNPKPNFTYSTLTPLALDDLDLSGGIASSGSTYVTYEDLYYPAFNIDGFGPVTPNGVLARFTIDTSGLSDGDQFTVNFNSEFPSTFLYQSGQTITPVSLTSGGPFSITVAVPEPSTLAFIAALGGLTLLRRPRACNC
ncbi:MAG: PEP-CTERM sorting domain-containing protein [Chryseolinea sp.]